MLQCLSTGSYVKGSILIGVINGINSIGMPSLFLFLVFHVNFFLKGYFTNIFCSVLNLVNCSHGVYVFACVFVCVFASLCSKNDS